MDSINNLFEQKKNDYKQARYDERKKIVQKLSEFGFHVSNRGNAGRGRSDYTSGRRIAPCDLSNHLWIDCLTPDKKTAVVVSLQTPEVDPRTRNPHELMDVISVDCFPNDESIVAEQNSSYMQSVSKRYGVSTLYEEGYFLNVITPYALPLSETDLNELAELILERSRQANAA